MADSSRSKSAGGNPALIDHVAGLLTGHKGPREIRVEEALLRNALGKVQKKALLDERPASSQ